MAEIKTWFPTSIYYESNLLTTEENSALGNKILNIKNNITAGGEDWLCNTYNTLGTYDLLADADFDNLVSKVSLHVNEYVQMHGSNYQYKCNAAWANVYKNKDYQEFHIHAGNTISAVYYVDVPSGSGDIVWKSPIEPDMLPIKDITAYNDLSYKTCFYSPKPGDLIIFRSYLSHMVKQGTNDAERISVAFNF
jgi:uncharacterized protein (TIGR02466 family)